MAKGTATETRPRDADRSQKDILDAALAEFAEHGLGGARMDRIAERAGVNKRLIYYYFESKESLFLAVLERAYEGIRGEEQQLNLTQVEPVEAIRRLIAFTWNYYIEHPEFLTLLNSENLHRARHLKQSTKIPAMHSPLVQTLADVLERGHKSRHVPRRRRPGAAVHLDRRAVVLLPRQQPHAVDHLRPAAARRQGQGRAPVAHDRPGAGLPGARLNACRRPALDRRTVAQTCGPALVRKTAGFP